MEFQYCQPLNYYKRFPSWPVSVGGIVLGGDAPVRVQTMTNTPTSDVRGTSAQVNLLHRAGAEYVRIAVASPAEVKSFREIKNMLRKEGCHVPLIADVHFNPVIALEMASVADKVRINPGNFLGPRKDKKYTDLDYQTELEQTHEKLLPLLDACRTNGTALRIGSNSGSLSARIMDRYGNTAEGMTEAALEFLRIFESEGFRNAVVSMKTSNAVTMVHTTRLFVNKMWNEQLFFPVHLGVTEAGSGKTGRIKSALGSGMLLAEGVGDTIRVSLTEKPENEIPVALEIIRETERLQQKAAQKKSVVLGFDPFQVNRQTKTLKNKVGKEILLATECSEFEDLADFVSGQTGEELTGSRIKRISENLSFYEIREMALLNREDALFWPVPVPDSSPEEWLVKITVQAGALLTDGLIQGLWLGENLIPHKHQLSEIIPDILQASRRRISKPEYISCPSCSRTSFAIEDITEAVKEATKHLAGMKIAVMGCLVNGPGEMEDAEYGIVGAGGDKVVLYKKGEVYRKSVNVADAVAELVRMIDSDRLDNSK